MIEDFLINNRLERNYSYDDDTIVGLEEIIFSSEIPTEEILKNMKIFSLGEILNYNKRLTSKARTEYENYLEVGDTYRDEIVADLVLEQLAKSSKNVLYYVDSLYGNYFLYVDEGESDEGK